MRVDEARTRKVGRRSLGDGLQAENYDWIQTMKRTRGPSASVLGLEESADIAVESDFLRTVLYTFLLGCLGGLMIYLSIRVSAGEGRSLFMMTATLAAFLACGAAAARRRKWLRLVLVLGSLGAFALLVDQVVYYQWHKRVDGQMAILRRDIESVPLRPTSFRIDPDGEILLTFEPPPLAWTYRLDSASSLGHTLVAAWYGILSRVTRGRQLDRVAGTIVHPHESYSVAVMSDEKTLACQEGDEGHWTLSIERRPGYRPL